MTMTKRVLVTGGGTFLGDYIAAALLAEGADVTLLVRPGAEENIGPLGEHVRWFTADVWEPSSLKGRARGHHTVIHTVGSLTADPSRGLTYHYLNFVSARNVANMCVNSGAPHLMLLSGVHAPWVNGTYIQTKREAEKYIERLGINYTIIRAPLTYVRGAHRPLFYRVMSLFRYIPPLNWLAFNRIAPMPVDILARGVARLVLEPDTQPKHIYYAQDLRRRNSDQEKKRGRVPLNAPPTVNAPSGFDPFEPPLQEGDTAKFQWKPPER